VAHLPGHPWLPPDHDDDLDDELVDDVHPWPDITVTEVDNPVVACLLDVDGFPLIELRERRTVPFGYRL